MMTLLERFEAKYIPEPNSGCWIWTGASAGQNGFLPSQYGFMRFSKPRRWRLAHRVSYELHRGDIPQGMCVLHRCDQPCCVNPDHLFLGTGADNMRDKVSKGRGGAPRGTKSGKAKLTDSMVREIRAAQGSSRQLAPRFGVDHTTISMIKRGETWKHVQ